MKPSIKNAALVGLGLAVGCAAAAVNPTGVGVATAKPKVGKWQCYQVNKFPYARDASDIQRAMDISRGLNKAASHVPAGTIQGLLGGKFVCVKG